jgi:hypothetical protein
MARKIAVAHTDRSLQLLANELQCIAERLREAAERFRQTGLKTTISVDTQTSVDRGILELRKFHRSVEMKISNLLDEQEHARGRADLQQAATGKRRERLTASGKVST